jgi:hypothetical protein
VNYILLAAFFIFLFVLFLLSFFIGFVVPTHVTMTEDKSGRLDAVQIALQIELLIGGVSHIHVLPLSPGPSPPRTAFDLVLPPPEAFCLPNVTQPQYPAFAASNSNWQAIFGLIQQPAFLWQCWGPGSLSDYPNIKTLWQAWDEGEVVCGVGRRPPLRSVEKEWGAKVDQRTNKGRLQSWRPHRDAAVRSLGAPLHSC